METPANCSVGCSQSRSIRVVMAGSGPFCTLHNQTAGKEGDRRKKNVDQGVDPEQGPQALAQREARFAGQTVLKQPAIHVQIAS